jgi:hypothetical protein
LVGQNSRRQFLDFTQQCLIRNLLGRIKKFVFSIPKKEVEGVEAETTIVKS